MQPDLHMLFCLCDFVLPGVIKTFQTVRAGWEAGWLVVGEARGSGGGAVPAPRGGVRASETLGGGFRWQLFCYIHEYRVLFLKDELMCRYFHGIAMNMRDPSVFLQYAVSIC